MGRGGLRVVDLLSGWYVYVCVCVLDVDIVIYKLT